jgi:hypothetical protein
MVVGAGGKYAIQLDKENGHYGWLFELKACGWVSLRPAIPVEMEAAERQARYNEFFASLHQTHLIH